MASHRTFLLEVGICHTASFMFNQLLLPERGFLLEGKMPPAFLVCSEYLVAGCGERLLSEILETFGFCRHCANFANLLVRALYTMSAGTGSHWDHRALLAQVL